MDYLKANAPFWKREESPKGTELDRSPRPRRCRRSALDQILMAKQSKVPARRGRAGSTVPKAKFPKINSGELLTLLDFVRFAVSRFIEAKLVFAHGTTDPVAEAAFLVCEALHLHPDQFESLRDRARHRGRGQEDPRSDRAPRHHADARRLSRQQDLHARPAVLCRRAHHRAALLHRRIAGFAFRRRRRARRFADRRSLVGRKRARSLHRLGLPCDPGEPEFSECRNRRGGYFKGRARGRRSQRRRLRP